MTTPRPWPHESTRVTGREVQRYRRQRGMSTDQLAAAVTDLGLRYTRSQVTNLEAGRRDSITTGELSVLSAALGVPRLLLEFPLGRVDVVEALPGVEVSPLVALHWLETGWLAEPPGLWPPVVEPFSTEDGRRIEHYRRHWELIKAWSGTEGAIKALSGEAGEEATAELTRLERERSGKVSELRTLRALLRKDGLTPPELPRSYRSSELRQALGEADEDVAS